eukprot:31086-Prorocentrum_minimum.AAC.2
MGRNLEEEKFPARSRRAVCELTCAERRGSQGDVSPAAVDNLVHFCDSVQCFLEDAGTDDAAERAQVRERRNGKGRSLRLARHSRLNK